MATFTSSDDLQGAEFVDAEPAWRAVLQGPTCPTS